MKTAVYNLTGTVMDLVLSSIQWLINLCLTVQVEIGNRLLLFLTYIFKAILWLIDRSRVEHAELVMSQEYLSTELEILMAVSKIKEDALSKKKWTNYHTATLTELSQQLYDNCNWDEDKIHGYIKNIVESIPGLTYIVGDEDDDSDAIEIGND
jgi:hypothetical protein